MPLDLIFNILPVLVAGYYIFRLLIPGKGYRSSHLFLVFLFGLTILVEGFTIGVDYIEGQNAYYLIPVFLATALAFAPTFYLFVTNITGKELQAESVLKLYYPSIFCGSIDLLLIILIQTLEKGVPLHHVVYVLLWIINIGGLTVGFIVQNVVLLIRSHRLIKNYRQGLGELYSFEEGVNLRWVTVFSYGYIAFFIGLIVTSLPGFDDYLSYSFDLVLLFFIIYAGSNALKQYSILQTIDAIRLDSPGETVTPGAEQAPELEGKSRFPEIRETLESVMEEKSHI